MKRYTEYKDSGVPWIGEIPGHWEVRRIGSLFVENCVQNIQKLNTKAYKFFYGSLVRKDADIVIDEALLETYSKYTILQPNNIVINGLNLNYDFVSQRVAIAREEGIITSAYLALSPRQNVNSAFFAFLLKGMDSMKLFHGMGAGIRLTLSYNELKKASVPIPSPAEQEKIVAFLDKQTNLIESCICLRERELQTLNELKQAKIASAVTRGLNPDVPMKDSGIPWIGMIPAHWEIKKLKYLFNERSEKGYPDEPVLCSTQKYGVIPQSLYENRVVVVNKGLEGLKLVEVGDFVISLRSFQGGIEYAYYRGIISAAYTVLSPRKGINSEYLKHLLKSQPFIELLKTCVTGIREGQNINYSLLKNKEWAFPPPEEQDAIISYLTNRNIDEYIKSLEKEIEYLKEYKQRLISDVVTGKVDVRDEA